MCADIDIFKKKKNNIAIIRIMIISNFKIEIKLPGCNGIYSTL